MKLFASKRRTAKHLILIQYTRQERYFTIKIHAETEDRRLVQGKMTANINDKGIFTLPFKLTAKSTAHIVFTYGLKQE
jgi:hypothetical protein